LSRYTKHYADLTISTTLQTDPSIPVGDLEPTSSESTNGGGPQDVLADETDACASATDMQSSEESLDPLWNELEVHESTEMGCWGDIEHFDVEDVEGGSGGDGMNLTDPILIDILSDTPIHGVAELKGDAVPARGPPMGKKTCSIDLGSTDYKV
jgi:hypothetical protein